MYTFDKRIGFSEADLQHKMTLTAMIDTFQDSSSFHSDEVGVGFYYLEPKGLAWIINYWEVEIEKYPKYFDMVTVGTHPYDFRGFLGFRNYCLMDKDGNYLVKANSLWVLMDWAKQAPAKLTEEIKNAYVCEPKLDMTYSKRKITIPGEDEATREELKKITIEQHHLDFNGHVNNGQYIKVAMALVPDMPEIKKLRVEYRNQAHLGDVFCPVLYKHDNVYTVALNNEEGVPYSVLEFTCE